ncbi:helix-turn-helix domain-containing protein [Microbacterium sp.]|uniref:helix-turn-helix domain-containing protein n=1 Tax=Microbacterium sp. TaxID=51671 RepID=UPI003A8BB414
MTHDSWGRRLRAARESAMLTREALAARSGVSARTIASVELGSVERSRAATLGALIEALGLDVDPRTARAGSGQPARPVPRELPPVPPDVAGHFPDGQLYVSLGDGARRAAHERDAAADQPVLSRVLRRILTALGVHPGALHDDVAALAAQMRSWVASSRILLVLDAAPGDLDLSALLPSSPTAAVIVTARTVPLSLPARRHDRLAPLTPSAARAMLSALAGPERVDADPSAARRVVQLCDRLPAALRVAGLRLAARPDMPVADLAARLADERSRLDVLSSGDTGVRAGLMAAMKALSRTDRKKMRVVGDLGVDAGYGWTVAVARGIPLGQIVASVDRLAEGGLVDAYGVGSAQTYRVHPLTRLVAREWSARTGSPSQRGDRLARVLEAWRHTADVGAAQLPNGVDEVTDALADPADAGDLRHPAGDAAARMPRAWFRDTLPAFLAHVDAAFDLVPVHRIWPALTCLWRYWRAIDVVDDVDAVLERAQQRCERAEDRRGEAVVLNMRAIDTYARRPPAVCAGWAERAERIFADLDDRRGRVRALTALTLALSRSSAPDAAARAREAADDAVALAVALDRPAVIADAVAVQSRTPLSQGLLDEAETAVTAGFARLGPAASPQWIAQVHWVLGTVHHRRGDLARARELLADTHAYAISAEDRWGMAVSESELATVASGLGDPAHARRLLHEAHRHATEIGLERFAADLRRRLATASP